MAADVLTEAAAVLAEAGQTLHYRDLTDRMLARGNWRTGGKTPWQTTNARISSDIKKHGEASRFRRTGSGYYALNVATVPDAQQVEQPTTSSDSPGLTTPNTTLSFLDAAEQVLKSFGQRLPMHYREVTAKALELGLIQTKGSTPEATLNAQISSEIERMTRRGQAPRFVRYGKGLIGLRRSREKGLVDQIERHNAETRQRLRDRLKTTSPAAFETLIGELLGAIGFVEVTVTGRSKDGGIDVRGTLVVGDVIATRMAVQAKRWQQNVQSQTVREVRGGLGTHEQGLIVTTSDFSIRAREEAERTNAVPIALMNGQQLVALLIEHGIGVQRQPLDLIELNEDEGTDEQLA